MKPPTYRVSPNTGRNPIAQAVARQALARAVVDQKIAILMLEPGDPCAELLAGIARTMQIVHTAAQYDGTHNTATDSLKAGLTACIQAIIANHYDPTQSPTICTGLDAALDVARGITPLSMSRAVIAVP